MLLASMLDGTAAEAANKGLKAQAEALKAAMADRAVITEPVAPTSANHYADAKLYLATGDLPAALAGFRQVLAEDPRAIDAMNGLGVVYDRMGRHDLARGWYEAALAVAPDDAALLANLGYSLTLQKQWRVAIPFLRAAAAGRDATAAPTARRLLTLAAAAITAEAAATQVVAREAEVVLAATQSTAQGVRADAAAPTRRAITGPVLPRAVGPVMVAIGPARIEQAANGEAVLLLGSQSRAPAPMLVAALGDAATLVLVPQREPQQATQLTKAPAVVARLPRASTKVELVQAQVLLVRGDVHAQWLAAIRPFRPKPVPMPEPAPAPTMAFSEIARRAEPGMPPRRTPTPTVMLAAATLPAAPTPVLAPAALTRSTVAPPPILTSAAPMHQATQAQPAFEWLLPVRHSNSDRSRGRNSEQGQPSTPRFVASEAHSARVFDSDDGELNQFAARLKGRSDPASPAARQAAIARLEAVITRLHRA